MVTKTMSAWEARRQFGKVLKEVERDRTAFIVESHGEPVVAVVPVYILESWERSWDSFFDIMHRAQQNANMTEEEAMALALEVVAEVRAEQRSEAQVAAAS